jgi:carbamoyl-phosphate synthase large subunit
MSSTPRHPISVLVTGVGGGAVGHEALKALRLAERGYRLVAADRNARAVGLLDADRTYVIPSASDPNYFDAVLEVIRQEGVAAVVPGSDAELLILTRRRGELSEVGALLLANSEAVIDTCSDKERTASFLRSNGFSVPKTIRLETDADVARVEWLPAIIKPTSGGGGSNLVFVAQTPRELAFFADYVRSAGSIPIAQEYVGDLNSEYTVGVLHSLGGSFIGSVALRRDLTNALSTRARIRARAGRRVGEMLVVSSGISQGVIEDAPEIRNACERIAAAMQSCGPLNVQLRVVDGVVYVFEINPRFSGTSGFRALAGFNEADLLIRHHVDGLPIQRPSVQEGYALRSLRERLTTGDDEWRREELERWKRT